MAHLQEKMKTQKKKKKGKKIPPSSTLAISITYFVPRPCYAPHALICQSCFTHGRDSSKNRGLSPSYHGALPLARRKRQ